MATTIPIADRARNRFSRLFGRHGSNASANKTPPGLVKQDNPPGTCPADETSVEDACEECKCCKSIVFSTPHEDRGNINDIKSHNCGLAKALMKMFELSRNKGGIIRYMLHENGFDFEATRLAYFHINHATELPDYRLSNPAYLHSKVRSQQPIAMDNLDPAPQSCSPKLADLDHARIWLTFCRTKHGPRCQGTAEHSLSGLKLIDCETKQVCTPDLPQPYATLSYVWGDPSAEPSITTSFPRTIEDALIVTRELGVPYLWVDRHCINQADHEEKSAMLAIMDQIYAQSEFTIVATAGPNPRHGLPGVFMTPRHGSYRIKFVDGHLDYFTDPVIEVSRGDWNHRGWTYQEMLLSPRRLVFTESQMLFECRTHDFRESINWPCLDREGYLTTSSMVSTKDDEALPMSRQTYHVFPKHGLGRSPEDIYDRILEYSGRKLSSDSDKLVAMNGIFNAFRRNVPGYLHHFWGIPILETGTISFLEGLCWTPLSRPRTTRERFPTWSWGSAMVQLRLARAPPHNFGNKSDGTHVTLTRLDGSREDLCTFAEDWRGHDEHRPWIEISTWARLSTVHSNPGYVAYFDSYHEYHQSHSVFFLFEHAFFPEQYFLLATQKKDGTFRRLGIAKQNLNHGEDWKKINAWTYRKARIL